MRLQLTTGSNEEVFRIRITEDSEGILIQGGGEWGHNWNICRLDMEDDKMRLITYRSIADENISVDANGRILVVAK